MANAFDVIVVCGPTGSGKSSLAMALCEKIGAELICADSMQIYKHMDIGTAKDSPEQCRRIPHHMMDIIEPAEEYSAAMYEQQAVKCVRDITARGKIPLVCGGTGLYIDALLKGHSFLDYSPELRRDFEKRWTEEGGAALMAQLAECDPDSAEKLHANDKKRIIRALEVYTLTGSSITRHNEMSRQRPVRYRSAEIALCPVDRQQLYDRIDRRVDEMMQQGLAEEVKTLAGASSLGKTAKQAIGYKELLEYYEGKTDIKSAVELIKKRSRNYAKRQLTWFRARNSIKWINYDTYDISALLPIATKFIFGE